MRRGRFAPRLGWAVAAVAGAYFLSLLRYGLQLGEDGDVVYLIYRALSGQRPYIDFASGYAPLHFYGNAAFMLLFGDNILVLRAVAAAANTLAVFFLYRLAARVMPPAVAVAPALGYAAFMPVYPGEFATFNIPYPAWHVVAAWGASTLALLRFCRGRGIGWVWLAGALAGVGCALKPNTGAFNLAALGMILLFASAGSGRWWDRIVWWVLLLGILGAVASVLGFRVAERDARLLLWPVFALGVLRAVTIGRAAVRPAVAPARFSRAALALMGGFAVVTAPWVAYYIRELGAQGFIRDVLYIGTTHALFFYMAIPTLGKWYAAMGAAAVAALLGGRVLEGLRARRLPFLLLFLAGGIGAAAFVLWRAPMIEGPWRAVMQRMEPLCFGGAILAHWAGVIFLGRALLQHGEGRRGGSLAVVIGAPMLFLSIYPRSDFFHWVLSAPITLVLGAMLYWRVARPWLGNGAWKQWLAAVPVYAAIVFLAWPGLTTSWRIHTAAADELVTLGLARAPVVLEAGRRRRFEDLENLVRAIRNEADDATTLLGFPNLHLVNFLSGRHVPGRYGSFHPGSPDHVVEAGIVTALERHHTPLIAINHDLQLYMGHAPLYYFMLSEYVRRHYELVAAVGSYDLLRRRRGEPPARLFDPQSAFRNPHSAIAQDCVRALSTAVRRRPDTALGLAPCWEQSTDRLQQRALRLARSTKDPAGILPLAAALRDGKLGPGASILAARAIGEIADARAFSILFQAESTVSGGQARDELRTAIFNVALRALIEGYFVVPRDSGRSEVRADAASRDIAVAWLGGFDPRLWYAGAWIAGAAGVEAAVPRLLELLRRDDLGFRMVTGDALVRLGASDGTVEPLLQSMTHDESFIPPVVFNWSRASPERATQVLAQTFREGNRLQRETIAFLAAALGDRELGEVVRAGITDPDPRVRMASMWAAGVLRLSDARGDLERAAQRDPDDRVRQFARAALWWLDRS